MESPSFPAVESSPIIKFHQLTSSSDNSSSRIFDKDYPFDFTHHQSHPSLALVSPDTQSSHSVYTVGGSLTSPILVTKQALSVVSPLGSGNASSLAASQEQGAGPAPLVPRPLPVLESMGTPLPTMPVFPSHQQIKTTSSVLDSAITQSLAAPILLAHCDHHHRAADGGCPVRLNKFVRRLYDMLLVEKDSGVVEWRRGLLVLYSTDAFSKRILPKYFNTRNFKTFRRQLNYYGFVHVRSFSATGNTTTALWINQELAKDDANDDISAVLKLRRVEPCETAKTVEGRRNRKELALHTVEEDIGLNSKTLQLDHIRSMAIRGEDYGIGTTLLLPQNTSKSLSTTVVPLTKNDKSGGIPRVVHIPTDSEESNHHSDSCGEDESTGSPSPMARQAWQTEGFHNTNTAAANMLLMLARS